MLKHFGAHTHTHKCIWPLEFPTRPFELNTFTASPFMCRWQFDQNCAVLSQCVYIVINVHSHASCGLTVAPPPHTVINVHSHASCGLTVAPPPHTVINVHSHASAGLTVAAPPHTVINVHSHASCGLTVAPPPTHGDKCPFPR